MAIRHVRICFTFRSAHEFRRATKLLCGIGFAAALLSSRATAQQGAWTRGAQMPGASSHLEAASLNGKVYAISGYATDRLGIYDPSTDRWTTGTALQVPGHQRMEYLENFGRAVARNKIWVFGGTSSAGTQGNVFSYDPATDQWSLAAPMVTPRSDVATVIVGTKIYVIGGRDADGGAVRTVEIFDPMHNSWTTGPPLPYRRTGMVAGTLNGKIYVAGGSDGEDIFITGLMLDPKATKPEWQPIAEMPMGSGLRALRGTVLHDPTARDDKLFIVGCGPSKDQVESYDPSSDTWETNYPKVPLGRNDGGITAQDIPDGHVVYYVGGGNAHPTDELDVLSLKPDADAPVITNPTDLDVLSTNQGFDGKAWRSASPMPSGRAAFGIAPSGGKIYVGGGQVLRTEGCSPPTNILEVFDPNSGWSTLPPLPTARLHLSADAVGGKVYFIGGEVQDAPGECHAVHTNEAFDTATQKWHIFAPMPTARYATGIATGANNKIYVFGGADDQGNALNVLEEFDPATGFWTSKQPMPTARLFPSVGVVNNIMYVIGGTAISSGQTGIATGVVEAYDPANDSWTTGLSAEPTLRRSRAGVAVLDNVIYVFGGTQKFHQITTNEAYHPPPEDRWFTASAMPAARYALGGAAVGHQIFAIGGLLRGVATLGKPFIYQITATNNPLKYDALNLPCGLNVNKDAGLIYGIPCPPASLNNNVTIVAQNHDSASRSSLIFSVQPASTPPTTPPPQIVSNPSVTGRAGQFFSFQVLATNTGPSLVYKAGNLPPGVRIDRNTGLISGTTTVTGNFAVSLSVTTNGATATNVLQLTFVDDPSVPIITSPETVYIVPGEQFSYTISTEENGTSFSFMGTDGDLHNQATSAGLPPGLSFDGIDTIAGVFSPSQSSDSAEFTASDIGVTPDTIKIRPPLVNSIQLVAAKSSTAAAASLNLVSVNTGGSGVRPLNFLQPVALSRKVQGTTECDINVLGETSTECRSGGPNGNYELVARLEDPIVKVVDVAVSAGTGQVTDFSFNDNQILVRLTGVTNKQTTQVRFSGIKAGTFSGHFAIPITVVLGDVNGDGVVNQIDVMEARMHVGEVVAQKNCRFDVTGDGVINGADISFIQAHQ